MEKYRVCILSYQTYKEIIIADIQNYFVKYLIAINDGAQIV